MDSIVTFFQMVLILGLAILLAYFFAKIAHNSESDKEEWRNARSGYPGRNTDNSQQKKAEYEMAYQREQSHTKKNTSYSRNFCMILKEKLKKYGAAIFWGIVFTYFIGSAFWYNFSDVFSEKSYQEIEKNENTSDYDYLEAASRLMMYPSTMTVSAVASLYGDTTVGNEWSKYFSVNNTPITGTVPHEITIWQGQNLTVLTRIEEDDKIDDVGVQLSEHVITGDDLKYGFSIRQEIEVSEANGRYSGHSVEWTVVYTFKPN